MKAPPTLRGSALALAFVALLASACTSPMQPRSASRARASSSPAPRVVRQQEPPILGAKAPPPGALVRFDSCEALLDDIRKRARKLVGPYGFEYGSIGYGHGDLSEPGAGMVTADALSAPVPAPSEGVSGTNVQEGGIDEPDTVKTDGDLLLALHGRRLFRVDVSDETDPQPAGSIRIPGYGHQMLIVDDRALVISTQHVWRKKAREVLSDPSRTSVTVIEMDGDTMRQVARIEMEGSYVAARENGGIARLVLRSAVAGLEFKQPRDWTGPAFMRAIQRNRARVDRSKLSHWFPDYRVHRAGSASDPQPIVPCEEVHRPRLQSGLGTTSVVAIDAARAEIVGAASINADADEVYASADNLYVATHPWSQVHLGRAERTQIHMFDTRDPANIEHRASGKVAGWILNQFAMSEHDGVLRVATTRLEPGKRARTVSAVVTLRADGDRLEQIGMADGLGKNERIYAVRFIQDRGYVVTFRQVDPLYVIDLTDPGQPEVLGELKIPGFSSYLHPVGDGLLLGIGQDVSARGRMRGAQASLFDVSDPAHPARLHQMDLGGGEANVAWDHHAFLWWEPTKLALLPLSIWDEEPFNGAVGLRVGGDEGISEVGRLSHDHGKRRSYRGGITRTVIVRSVVYSMSPLGVMASDLEDLSERAFLRWRETR